MPDRIKFLGHATVLIELDGVRLLTDPLLREQAFFLFGGLDDLAKKAETLGAKL